MLMLVEKGRNTLTFLSSPLPVFKTLRFSPVVSKIAMSLLQLPASEAVSQKKIVLAFRFFTIEFPPLMKPQFAEQPT